jgi:hypothetical protein
MVTRIVRYFTALPTVLIVAFVSRRCGRSDFGSDI